MEMESRIKTLTPNAPLLTEDLLSLYKDYSRVQVFRILEKAEEGGLLVNYCRGVYYVPKKTPFGTSAFDVDALMERRYISYQGQTYGIYGGLTLQNAFSLTDQVPNVVEIVSNKEHSRKRAVTIGKRTFILRKSRLEINNENVYAYMILELFNTLGDEPLRPEGKRRLIAWLSEKKVKKDDLVKVASSFPSKALRKLVENGVYDEAA